MDELQSSRFGSLEGGRGSITWSLDPADRFLSIGLSGGLLTFVLQACAKRIKEAVAMEAVDADDWDVVNRLSRIAWQIRTAGCVRSMDLSDCRALGSVKIDQNLGDLFNVLNMIRSVVADAKVDPASGDLAVKSVAQVMGA